MSLTEKARFSLVKLFLQLVSEKLEEARKLREETWTVFRQSPLDPLRITSSNQVHTAKIFGRHCVLTRNSPETVQLSRGACFPSLYPRRHSDYHISPP